MSASAPWARNAGEMAARIRAFDWSRTPLGAIETWTERCHGIVDTVVASGFPTIALIGPELIQIYNDSYRDLMGGKHPAGLGQPSLECWPEAAAIDGPIYERVFAGETVMLEDSRRRLLRRDAPEDAWFTISYSPLRDMDGSVADILVTTIETTDRVRAQHALRESEELRRIGFAAGRMGAWQWDLGNRLVWGDPQFLALWGFPPSDEPHPLALFTDRMSAAGAAEIDAIVGRAIRNGEEFDGPLEIVAGPTAGRWIRWRGRTNDERASILHGITFDITDQVRAENELRESEELFRSFAENSTDTLWIFDAAQRKLDYLSPAFAAMFGEEPERIAAELGRFAELVHPDDRGIVAEAVPKVMSQGGTYQIEYRIRRPSDGAIRWIQDTGFPIRDGEGRVCRIGGVAQDVTNRREADDALRTSEAQLQVMVAELHHRTRNLIGVVGMIARQLIASSTSLADFRTRFIERLEALSRVQSLFSRRARERIAVGDIVRLELDALGADLAGDRVRIEGGIVALRKSAVQTLSLAIHELATNARKYGALSGESGELVVRWEPYAAETGKRRLRLVWTETGIDARVEATEGPLREGGYGRKLIEEALPYTLKATTTYRLGRDRLDCTIDLPLER